MAPNGSSSGSSSKGHLSWRPTKIMNMRDLSKDDDFLSHLLVEKLGTGTVPLLVHKMDASRRLPKVPANDLLEIVRRLVVAKGPLQNVIRSAVDELLLLGSVRYYLQSYTQKQINAFATHASRYFELYHPSGSIEISHTSRYSHRTGKSELCILATRYLAPGSVITELKGSMANLTDEEDRELKRTDLRNSDIRRDFSVIHSKSMKKNHLFLGPARFVNHDCDNNCELFREGRYITFRVLRPISIGDEITAHYGDGYFGRKNRHCLCETCERKGRGGYAPDHTDDDCPSSDSSASDSESDSDSGTSSNAVGAKDDASQNQVNLDERRTRRGVYAIVSKEEDQSDESEDEDENVVPLAGATDIPSAGEIELMAEVDTVSELTSLASSRAPSNSGHPGSSRLDLPAATSSDLTPLSRSTSSLSSLSSMEDKGPPSNQSSPYRSIISTRRQKVQEAARASEETRGSTSASSTPTKRLTRSSASLLTPSREKGKEKDNRTPLSTTASTPRKTDKGKGREESVKIKKEDVDSRVLRARPSLSAVASEGARDVPLANSEAPKGPDGKLLPICATCRNILPVISVDHQVVWGLGFEKESKRKKNRQDCPRCMRHSAIYGQPWPRRVPLPGTSSNFLPTPREEATPVETIRRVTQKALPVLDRKLAAAASSSKRKRLHEDVEDEDDEVRSSKRQKGSQPPNGSPGPRRASQKQRQPEPLPEGQKRKRGRPRLTSLPQPVPVIKTEEEDPPLHSIGFKNQGRRLNGRFEKKSVAKNAQVPASPEDSPMRRAARARERERQKLEKEKELLNKRLSIEEGSESTSSKKARWDEDELPLRRVFPRPVTSFRSGSLFSRPNPMSFAARAWANPLISDDGSSEDEKGPDTPEESLSPPAIINVDPEEPEHRPSLIISTPAIPPSFTYKPSPFNFARRRWSSLSTSSPDGRPKRSVEIVVDDDSSTFPTLSSTRSTSKYNWDFGHDMYLSEEEDSHSVRPQNSICSSVLFSDDDVDARPRLLHHKYPSEVIYDHKLASFAPDLSSAPPTFIDAGWDSDISDP